MSPSEKIFTRGGQAVTRAQLEALKRSQEHRSESKRAAAKQRKSERRRVCKHLGKRAGGADVYGPRGVDCLKLHACAIFGKCSTTRQASGIAFCPKCPAYEAKPKRPTVKRRDADPDDGRGG